MKKCLKRSFIGFLACVTALSVAPAAVFAEEVAVTESEAVVSLQETAPVALTLGQEMAVPGATETVWYTFTPETDGYYLFVSVDGNVQDPCVYLYDTAAALTAKEDEIDYVEFNDDCDVDYNFELTSKLKAGKTYYYKVWVRDYDSEESFKVLLAEASSYNITFHANLEGACIIDNSDDENIRTENDTLVQKFLEDEYLNLGKYSAYSTDSNYHFVGWAHTPDAEYVIEDYDEVTQDDDLYAVWVKFSFELLAADDMVLYKGLDSDTETDYIYNPLTDEDDPITWEYYSLQPKMVTVKIDGEEYHETISYIRSLLNDYHEDFYPSYSIGLEQSAADPLKIGNTYDTTLTFLDQTVPLKVTIADNLIKSVSANKVILFDGLDSEEMEDYYYDDDGNEYSVKYQYYYVYRPEQITVEMTEGKKYSGDFYDVLYSIEDDYAIDINHYVTSDSQTAENPWAPGKTYNVTLVFGGIEAHYKVNIQKSITLNKTKATLVAGKSTTLKATVTKGYPDSKKVTWKSSNKAVAKVSSTGKVTAVKPGTAKITAKLASGASVTCTVTVNPKGTTLSKVTKGSKAFTVKWKKQASKTTGYQIQYSTNKNFKSGNKTKLVSGAKKTSVKINKLKAKKTYYVRIRTYTKVGKKMYYSSWSKSKKVKTK